MAQIPRRSALTRRQITREDLVDQHPDVQDAIAPALDAKDAENDLLKAIGVTLSSLRNAAKIARQSSGVEEIWRKCEEAYNGMDDANRSEFTSARWAKPMVANGPATTGQSNINHNSTRSNIFLRLTSRYVDAGFAKLSEILLPADDKAFSFKETPVPKLIEARDDKRAVHDDKTGLPLTRPLNQGEVPPPAAAPLPPLPGPGGPALPGFPPGEVPPPAPGAVPPAPGAPPGPPTVPLTVADLAEENIQMARKKAKKAETRVYDWQIETQYRAENRKVLFDSARLGVGVLKGPVPKISKAMKTTRESGRIKIIYEEKIIPECVQVSPWNIFPDPSCGENFQNGSFLFERDWLSEKQLQDLKELPGYIGDEIDKILTEGPDGEYAKSRENGEQIESSSKDVTKGRFEVWYFTGQIKKDDLNLICGASGYSGDESDKAGHIQVPVVATMVNDRVIKAVPAPLESGKINYHSFPWTRRTGHWAGVGIAEQVFAPQRMLNAAVRSMLNNAGKSAGSQIVIDQSSIRPADGQWVITPDKLWYKTGDSSGAIKDIFELYKIPNVTEELMIIIKFALSTAEESTSIPLITQGQTGPEREIPETLGAAQIQNSNANQLLRSIGYSYDDHITEPVTIDYYEWHLMDPEVPDDEKGDFQIDAHGSVAMVERAIQDMTIAQMGPLTLNPAFGMDPKRWAKQMVMSKKLDPGDFMYTPEEQAKISAQPPPEDPRVTVAKVTMKGWVDEATVKSKSDDRKTQVDATVTLHELNMKRELALLDYANTHKIKLTDVQAELAQTAMKIQAEERLNTANARVTAMTAGMDHAAAAASDDKAHLVDLHKHHNPVAPPLDPNKPVVQTPGKAGNGKAASQSP